MNARPREGVFFQGGVNTGRRVEDNCDVMPSTVRQPCIVTASSPWVTLIAEVAPSLGRNLAGAAPSIDLHLLSPGIYNQGDNSGSAGERAGDRLHQVDLRISKLLRFGGARARASLDLYNAFNPNAVLLQKDTWDSRQTPEEILLARFFKFSVQCDF